MSRTSQDRKRAATQVELEALRRREHSLLGDKSEVSVDRGELAEGLAGAGQEAFRRREMPYGRFVHDDGGVRHVRQQIARAPDVIEM